MDFKLKAEYIELDNLLKNTDIAASGGEAKHLVLSGSVRVNGEKETRVRRKLRRGDYVETAGYRVDII